MKFRILICAMLSLFFAGVSHADNSVLGQQSMKQLPSEALDCATSGDKAQRAADISPDAPKKSVTDSAIL